MKKVLIGIFAVGALALTSCKKDYVCDCTITSSTDDGAGTVTSSTSEVAYQFNDMKKKDAEEACTAWDETSASVTAGTVVSSTEYSCTLQ
jgi:hypothetical protein